MTAYVIVDVRIMDLENYEVVKKLTPPVVSAFGGKYLARGGKMAKLAGDWNPDRLVIMEFPSVEKAKEWAESPEYEPVKTIRDQTAKINMVVVEALTQPPRELIG